MAQPPKKPVQPSSGSRNPDWTWDERVLALDLYLKHKGRPQGGKYHPDVVALSSLLRLAASARYGSISPTFRNENGVYTKLMNFQQYDPEFASRGRIGMKHGAKDDGLVWNQYASDPAQCSAVAAAIRAQIQAGLVDASHTEDEDEEGTDAAEGRILTRVHRGRERSRELVKKKKERFRKQYGRLFCEICLIDAALFGIDGMSWFECHHIKPLHTLEPGTKTKLSDLIVACPNCHRLIHASRPWLSVDEVRQIVLTFMERLGTATEESR